MRGERAHTMTAYFVELGRRVSDVARFKWLRLGIQLMDAMGVAA